MPTSKNKEERSQINNISLPLKELENENKWTQLVQRRKKNGNKQSGGKKKKERKKEKINKTKSYGFENINKTDKYFSGVTYVFLHKILYSH